MFQGNVKDLDQMRLRAQIELIKFRLDCVTQL